MPSMKRSTHAVDTDVFRATPKTPPPHESLKQWLTLCNDRHGIECQPPGTRNSALRTSPEWVIDGKNLCIVPGDDADRYAALSYVWPKPEEEPAAGLMLDADTIDMLQQPGSLRPSRILCLPKVVREAIQLLLLVGERYLWVDRLCIVQNDEHTREQAEHMDEIYSEAYFTIIAAAASGLYGEKSDVADPDALSGSVEDHYSSLIFSTWGSRGWTFQEQILSRRAVVFLENDIFWDCRCSVWDTRDLDPDKQHEHQLLGHQQLAEQLALDNRPDFSHYIELVCLFNSRDLTYPQDVLSAFSGILNRLKPGFPPWVRRRHSRLFHRCGASMAAFQQSPPASIQRWRLRVAGDTAPHMVLVRLAMSRRPFQLMRRA